MEFSPLRWSREPQGQRSRQRRRDVASKLINVGGKIDVFVVDTLEWMTTGTLTIASTEAKDCL